MTRPFLTPSAKLPPSPIAYIYWQNPNCIYSVSILINPWQPYIFHAFQRESVDTTACLLSFAVLSVAEKLNLFRTTFKNFPCHSPYSTFLLIFRISIYPLLLHPFERWFSLAVYFQLYDFWDAVKRRGHGNCRISVVVGWIGGSLRMNFIVCIWPITVWNPVYVSFTYYPRLGRRFSIWLFWD
mgnify:CR=1 FL=1